MSSRSIAHNGITSYLHRFLEWSAAMNYSSETTHKRDNSLQRFIVWCDARGLDNPQDVTSPVLERYRRHLFHYRKANGDPLSFSTQHGYLVPLKAFFKWLNKENYILYNPASEFDLPKVPKRLPKHILSIEETEDMLRHTHKFTVTWALVTGPLWKPFIQPVSGAWSWSISKYTILISLVARPLFLMARGKRIAWYLLATGPVPGCASIWKRCDQHWLPAMTMAIYF